MMTNEFRDYLKKQGKKEHVIQGLVDSVRRFENYLQKRNKEIHHVTKQDLFDYATACESERKGSAKIRIRGVALYFGYIGNNEMTTAANGLREMGISQDRHLFKLKDFLWVNQAHVSKLKMVSITDIGQMIESGKTECERKKLAKRTGIPVGDILELVKLSNLARLAGVKSVRARLFHEAGLDTWEEIAPLDASELRDGCIHFVKSTSFPGIPPTPKEAAYTVNSAKTMPRIVEW